MTPISLMTDSTFEHREKTVRHLDGLPARQRG